jgi:putative acetyltransferase
LERIEIRESLPSDIASIEKLYPDAFPDEDLLPLVRELLQETPIALSIVGIIGTSLVGHVIFTTCGIAGYTDKVALLGPLAVVTAWQRQGFGSAIVRAGLQQLTTGKYRRDPSLRARRPHLLWAFRLCA